MGVVAGFFAGVFMVPWPRLTIGDCILLNQFFPILQEFRTICKTRNQFKEKRFLKQ
jgi:hypothetical protein